MKIKKDVQILIRVTKEEKENFKECCEQNEESFQRVLRNYIKAYIKENKKGD